MRPFLLRSLAPLLLACACALPAPAQTREDLRINTAPDKQQEGSGDSGAPVFAYFIAICSTVLILFTLMKPSRRRM